MFCLLIEYLEYKAWHRGFYEDDNFMDYASFLDDFTRHPYGSGYWRD